jgi:hypothetical protein
VSFLPKVHLSSRSVYWPYDTSGAELVWGTVIQPHEDFTGSHIIHIPPSSSIGGVEINNVRIQGMVVYGNSFQPGGSDLNGITMEGDVRAVELLDVTVSQTSGHGILSLPDANLNKPRGGVFDHISVWSAGKLAGTTQWGIYLDGFTDAKFNAISVIDCRGGGIRLEAPGQITGTHIHSVFNHGVGIHISGESGNGGLNWSTIVTDRNVKEGVLIDAYGRQRILLSNLELRRDGGNEENIGAVNPYAALSLKGTSDHSVCPVLLSNFSTVVEDTDDNNVNWTPVTGISCEYITELHIDGRVWGATTPISLGTGARDAEVYISSTTTFWTGDPTAMVEDIGQGREVMYPIVVGTNTWTAMPAAETPFGDPRERYMRADLRHKSRCCMSAQVAVAGTSTAVLKIQYTTDLDDRGWWADLTSSAAIGATGYTESDEDLIPSGAKHKVLLRCAGDGGDGIVSPAVQIVALHAW